MPPLTPIITCEHGGNRVPSGYRALMRPLARQLKTHRGYDLGALPLAKSLAKALSAPLFASTVSRLLVDLNRSLHHPRLHGLPVRLLSATERDEIVRAYYAPHRESLQRTIESRVILGERVLHLAVHSFAPVLDGKRRNADLGLLYDPSRREERAFCAELRSALASRDPDLRVRFNYPYRGTSDGLTTALRRRFPDAQYLGIEIEMNQGFSAPGRVRRIERALVPALLTLAKTPGFSDKEAASGRGRSKSGAIRARRNAAHDDTR